LRSIQSGPAPDKISAVCPLLWFLYFSPMALAHPIHLQHVDGWQTEIAEQADGSLRVTVSAPGGRTWAAEKPTIEEAIAVSVRILSDQRGAVAEAVESPL
jgi:hypothetical protein